MNKLYKIVYQGSDGRAVAHVTADDEHDACALWHRNTHGMTYILSVERAFERSPREVLEDAVFDRMP